MVEQMFGLTEAQKVQRKVALKVYHSAEKMVRWRAVPMAHHSAELLARSWAVPTARQLAFPMAHHWVGSRVVH